jgi:DNA helicase-2/ATP-dependent DNA helicase PcrA
MGPVNARRIIDQLGEAAGSLAAMGAITPPTGSQIDFQRLTALFTTLSEPERPWPGQVRQVREWYQPHLERIYEHVHTRIGDLEQLEQLSQQYPSRERFITELTLDPPQVTSDLSGSPLLDEDYLVLSTIHSAKGMEWDSVFLLNVVDGTFPSEFATGKPELIDEERRLLYVAMTRARNELQLVSPLKFPITQQAPRADGHVYGGRSRFLSDKVLKCLEPGVFQGSRAGEGSLSNAQQPVAIDASERLKALW